MQINIKATNLDLTPSLKVYIEEKIGGLEKFLARFKKDSVRVQVEISRSSRHHRQGKVYYAEANLQLPGKMLRVEEDEWDIRIAIDSIKDKLQQEIKKYLRQPEGKQRMSRPNK